ncbi:GMC oxidoreductase-like protein [Decorospora gaudefroyi]|uniref:GMC oxidoreductase-like protein n=1 Tax=Decorospora gaudefroyi TaxID=184978 RepID=A0A6A5KC45_9PLEO|nr:GMC oxidoreductase-like protein [Decorospora gaudefroyi]
MIPTIFAAGLTISLAYALPHAAVKRQVSELRSSYDFIIAGGGTSGLTVADRLTEAFPDKTVLVIEYGKVEYAPGMFDPPTAEWGGAGPRAGSFIFSSLPNPEVKNKTAFVLAGQAVGGSSCINGMFFDRGSRHDHDAWAKVASLDPDTGAVRWDWDGVFPYYKKSTKFTDPTPGVVTKYGYTWDRSAYGGTTPIYSSFPPFQWGDFHVAREAWKDMGIRVVDDCAGGDKDGICWVPTSQHPVTAMRSHSGLGHYADVESARPNYDLLVQHQVTRVVYTDGISSGPPLVEARSLIDDSMLNVTAKAEVVISAGALHTPTILQRSGIGPASFLKTADIPVVLDLPGVGSNFQDHSGPRMSWNYSRPGNFSNTPSDMLDPAYAAKAVADFNMVPALGPYTLAMGNTAIYVSLPNMTADYMAIIDKMRTMAADDSAGTYLPADSDPTLIAGYKRQLSVLADFLSNPQAPSLEVPFATGTGFVNINLHPLSRGTVRINPSNHLAQPILDYRTGSNPIDFDVYLAHLRYLRRTFTTPTMQKYGAAEVAPGASIQSDAALLEYTKETMGFSYMHPCCTAAMMPKHLGGVTGPDLKVHGAPGLRVVDISVLPFLTSSHTSSVAYAVGEKAADIIIEGWRE